MRSASGTCMTLAAAWLWGFAPGCAVLDAAGDGADDGQDDGHEGDTGVDSPVSSEAGPDQTVGLGVVVRLDGSDSDPRGSLTYEWTLTDAPPGSSATPSDADSAETTFRADRIGTYVARLVVAEGTNSGADTVTVTVREVGVIGVAGPDLTTYTGTPVTLEGAADPETSGISHSWTVLSAPTGSTAAPSDPEVGAPAFTPDQDGPYLLLLVVSRDGVEEAWDVARVTSYYPLTHLEYRVVDAEYSRNPELERIVMVADGPDRLHIHDPASGDETFVALPATPTSVSVSPDGTHAAVGHDGAVSYVRLTDASLVATYPVDTDVLDIVLAGNRIAYAMPRPASERIQCLRLTSGEVRPHGGQGLRGPSLAKLHPSGTALYVADSGVSPDDIEKFDIVDRTASFLYDSRYHGDYDMCGNLWMTDDGLRIFTRCGNVFQTSDVQKEDIVHIGRLEGTSRVDRIRHLDHSSIASRVVAIPVDFYADNLAADTVVRIHDDESLAVERTIRLAPFLSAGALHPAHGRFVFISADGTRVFVVVQADEASGILNDYAIVTYDLD